jgi:hypothetical protein
VVVGIVSLSFYQKRFGKINIRQSWFFLDEQYKTIK